MSEKVSIITILHGEKEFIPLIKHVLFVVKNVDSSTLDGELKKVALSTFFFGILFGLGQVI